MTDLREAPDDSDCPMCGEWRDSPDADCANCGWAPQQCSTCHETTTDYRVTDDDHVECSTCRETL